MTQDMTAAGEARALSPYERFGHEAGVRAIVERFYDLMEHEPMYAELRAMHDVDLSPMRSSLTGFLTAWLGGPRTWFEARPSVCIMSMHRTMSISPESAGQWVHAMSRAMAEGEIEPRLGAQLQDAFLRMATAMTNVPRDEN